MSSGQSSAPLSIRVELNASESKNLVVTKKPPPGYDVWMDLEIWMVRLGSLGPGCGFLPFLFRNAAFLLGFLDDRPNR